MILFYITIIAFGQKKKKMKGNLGGGRSADACVDVKELFRLEQCDQMARLLFNVWPFTSMKTCPMACKFCQSRSPIFSQIGNKPTKNCPRLCQNGKISLNLVTQVSSNKEVIMRREDSVVDTTYLLRRGEG